ncbi:MAG TPA: hypothetical protein ACFYEK_08445 [Candidatus Wunengus sp. YC60]|uniref:hypothetical protein n=1 Tax=Candidatus Wunengus sp. YC60 TaxID=3367697 RepID=UPI004024AD63
MVKKLTLGVGIFLISLITVFNFAEAGSGGGRRGTSPTVPEPVSCILVLAGGATLEVVRRIRNRRNSKNSDHQDTDGTAS